MRKGRPNRKGMIVSCAYCAAYFKSWPSCHAKYCSLDCHYNHKNKLAPQRFWSYVEKTKNCWLWTGSQQGTGYGTFGVTKRIRKLAHRYAWELTHGIIPDGSKVLHKCDVRNCVNPDHLFLGTNADNSADMVSKGRHSFGEKSASAKLNTTDVLEIMRMLSLKCTHQSIADTYNVSIGTITAIALGKNWKHLKHPISSSV